MNRGDIMDTLYSIAIILALMGLVALFAFGTYLYLADFKEHNDINCVGVLLNKSNISGYDQVTFTWTTFEGNHTTRTFNATPEIYNGAIVGLQYHYHSRDGKIDGISMPYEDRGL